MADASSLGARARFKAKTMIRVRPSEAKGVERAKGSFVKVTESKAIARVELASLMRTIGFSPVVAAAAVTNAKTQTASTLNTCEMSGGRMGRSIPATDYTDFFTESVKSLD